jgi:hypothetical protein
MTDKELLQQAYGAFYATQPKKEWVGLTDDEIKKVNQLGIYEKPLIEFARDIEAKLKEKNFD